MTIEEALDRFTKPDPDAPNVTWTRDEAMARYVGKGTRGIYYAYDDGRFGGMIRLPCPLPPWARSYEGIERFDEYDRQYYLAKLNDDEVSAQRYRHAQYTGEI